MWPSYSYQIFLCASLLSFTVAQGQDDGAVTNQPSVSQTRGSSVTAATSSPRTDGNTSPLATGSATVPSSSSSLSLSFDLSRASTLTQSTYVAPTSSTSSSSSTSISSSSETSSTPSTPSSSSQTSSSLARTTSSSTPTLIDVLVLTTYVADGSTSIPTVLSRTVVMVGTITGSSIAEVTAALNAASQQNSGSGLSSNNKKIIIGVVAGVGGLVVLAALGTLLYRILGKRRSHGDYSEAKTGSPDTSYDSDMPDFNPGARPRPGEISQNF